MHHSIATYWLTAARAQFVRPNDWQSWADKLILSTPDAPLWVVDMSRAKNFEELRKALADKFADELRAAAPASSDDTRIGYIWWRYQKNEITLNECLDLAGEAADAGGSRLSCEDIYDLLTQLEGDRDAESVVKERATALFSPLQELASGQWEAIQDAARGSPSGRPEL